MDYGPDCQQLFDNSDEFCFSHRDNYTGYHICAQLTSWFSSRSFYYEQYNYLNKLYIVCNWRRGRGLFPLKGRRGNTICNNELVNFFEDEKK